MMEAVFLKYSDISTGFLKNIDILTASLPIFFSIFIFTLAIVMLFYFVGCCAGQLLRMDKISSAITVAIGLSSVCFIGWYTYRLGVPLKHFLQVVFIFTLAPLVFCYRKYGLSAFKIELSSLYAVNSHPKCNSFSFKQDLVRCSEV